jgi:lipopolysaccharide/colanic/teichoic acid biosynthesis glycosyltransferase
MNAVVKAMLIIFASIIGISFLSAIVALISDVFEGKFKKNGIHRQGCYERFFKRPLDAFLSTGALLVLSPIILFLSILVRINLGSPVLFTQDRPGLNSAIFKNYKFRTMTDKRDSNGNLLPDEDRLTTFGKKLRSTSLDELPELINIIKGDMAIVGPRPLLVRYLPRYNAFQSRRHEVRPGLTGLAQVEGRNGIPWEEKFEKDVYYVDHISFLFDIRIIFKTIKTVFSREGINENGSATMKEFMGFSERND